MYRFKNPAIQMNHKVFFFVFIKYKKISIEILFKLSEHNKQAADDIIVLIV